jgi:hypothetical protein
VSISFRFYWTEGAGRRIQLPSCCQAEGWLWCCNGIELGNFHGGCMETVSGGRHHSPGVSRSLPRQVGGGEVFQSRVGAFRGIPPIGAPEGYHLPGHTTLHRTIHDLTPKACAEVCVQLASPTNHLGLWAPSRRCLLREAWAGRGSLLGGRRPVAPLHLQSRPDAMIHEFGVQLRGHDGAS